MDRSIQSIESHSKTSEPQSPPQHNQSRHEQEPPSLEAAGSFPSSGTLKLQAMSKRGSWKSKPSLEEARRFEQRRKPHRIPDASQPSGYRLARVGESEDEATGAKAEPFTMSTSLSGLDSFGIGVSLYYRQVRACVTTGSRGGFL